MPTKSLAHPSKNGIPGFNDNVEHGKNPVKQLDISHHKVLHKTVSKSMKMTKPGVFNRCVKYLSVL